MKCLHIIIAVLIHTEGIKCHFILQKIFDTELKLAESLENRLEQTTFTIEKSKRRLKNLISAKSSELSKEDYVGTPLTALVMVRRLAEDWASLVGAVASVSGIRSRELGEFRWPTRSHVEGAARALMRAQQTYELDTDLLSRGLEGPHFLTNVTAADCFEIAAQYYKKSFFTEARGWLEYALSKTSAHDGILRQNILHYFAAAYCFSGDPHGSWSILRTLLKEYPHSKPPDSLKNDYKNMVVQNCIFTEDKDNIYAFETHKRLCNGEGSVQRGLRCRYVHYHQSHLRFQPFKVEELQLDPPVLRFYDIITDEEVESLTTKAKKSMVRATVGTDNRVSEHRTSQVAWIRPGPTEKLSRRITEMTRLDVTYAEHHQVSRYSVSGEYLPHTDYFGVLTDYFEHDRMATLMFYLNDVKQGGNTVFMEWNLSVPPVKNSAVLWFNYLPSGDPDDSSDHSGCPVLKGTKWVLNKWFHNGGNEFTFPCPLAKNGSFKGYYL